MDDKVQNYIDEQIEKRRKAYQEEKLKTLKEQKLGDFEKKPKGAKNDDYPEVDEHGDRCRFIPAEITDEEYEELKKHIPDEIKEGPKANDWYTFVIVITLFAAIVTAIGISSKSELAAIIGGSIFGYMLFFMLPIISLLSKIEQNQRSRD